MHPLFFLRPVIGLFLLLSTVRGQLGPFDPTGFNFVGRIDR